jgi:hypothetical protein
LAVLCFYGTRLFDLTVSTLFPVLQIDRIQSGFYRWAVSLAGHVYEQEEGASSIEECLRSAFQNLPEDGGAVEIRYRGIGLGTFSTNYLQQAPYILADKLVEMYSVVMECVT